MAVGEDVIALEEEEDLLAEAGVKSGVVLMFLAPLELKPSRGKTVSIYSPSLPLSLSLSLFPHVLHLINHHTLHLDECYV